MARLQGETRGRCCRLSGTTSYIQARVTFCLSPTNLITQRVKGLFDDSFFFGGRALKKTSSVKSHALTIRTGLRLSRVPVVPQHLLRGRNHVTSAWRGATVEK